MRPQYVIVNLLTNIKTLVFIVSNFDLHLTDKFDSLMAKQLSFLTDCADFSSIHLHHLEISSVASYR